MKKIVSLCVFLLQLTFVNAQNGKYIPFPSNMIIAGFYEHGSGPPDRVSFRWETGGDTIINAIHYSKEYSGNDMIGGIRNDIPNKKVYRYSLTTKTEQLLYDFDLKVGDTIFKKNGFGFFPYLLPSPPGVKIDTAWVSRIDSVYMPHDGVYHKRFNFIAKVNINGIGTVLINTDSEKTSNVSIDIKFNPLVEGVGEFYNPITFYSPGLYLWRQFFQCVSIDRKIVIGSTLCNSIIFSVSEKNTRNSFTVYPNPSNGKLELKANLTMNNYFEITNILGKKIYTEKIENEITEIDLSTEKPGIYFIRIYNTTGNSQTKKIVIN
jgi:hypothetical protein